MAPQRRNLPHQDGGLWVTDGGIETTLIFHEKVPLADFAAFDLLRRPRGEAVLEKYFRAYGRIAERYGTSLVLESATWRASADWGARLGYGAHDLVAANRLAIRLLQRVRDAHPRVRTVISGCIGPRGDGYVPSSTMSADQAHEYHRVQVDTFAATAADLVSAMTMNYAEEAVGIARAAQEAAMPVAVSFTVETDGRLPTGQPLGEAIAQVDAETGSYPAYYMLNCAHPEHLAGALAGEAAWAGRIRGLRANASRKSHAELNESASLDAGNPNELAQQYAALKRGALRALNVLGGCCGTDHRHVERIVGVCAPLYAA